MNMSHGQNFYLFIFLHCIPLQKYTVLVLLTTSNFSLFYTSLMSQDLVQGHKVHRGLARPHIKYGTPNYTISTVGYILYKINYVVINTPQRSLLQRNAQNIVHIMAVIPQDVVALSIFT